MTDIVASKTEIYLLRHGECEGGNIFRGSTDVALTSRGFGQMSKSCSDNTADWQQVISSPLKRCRLFAESLCKQNKLPLLIDERIRELSFGDWDGRPIDKVWAEQAEHIQAWSADPSSTTPPNGESMEQIAARLNDFYLQLLERFEGRKLLLIMHGGVIRVLLSQLLGVPLRYANHFEVPYACMSKVNVYHSGDTQQIKLAGHNIGGLLE